MEIDGFKVEINEREMQLEILHGGEKAYMVYRFTGESIALMHTLVPSAIGGKGIGEALVKAAFLYANEIHKSVIVYCSFVTAFLETHPEYKEQLA